MSAIHLAHATGADGPFNRVSARHVAAPSLDVTAFASIAADDDGFYVVGLVWSMSAQNVNSIVLTVGNGCSVWRHSDDGRRTTRTCSNMLCEHRPHDRRCVCATAHPIRTKCAPSGSCANVCERSRHGRASLTSTELYGWQATSELPADLSTSSLHSACSAENPGNTRDRRMTPVTITR